MWVSRNLYRPDFDFPPVQVRVHLALNGIFSLKIYNSAGELVRVLDYEADANAPLDRTYPWDARNQNQEPVASGVYIIYYTSRLGSQQAKLLIAR